MVERWCGPGRVWQRLGEVPPGDCLVHFVHSLHGRSFLDALQVHEPGGSSGHAEAARGSRSPRHPSTGALSVSGTADQGPCWRACRVEVQAIAPGR